jgi:transketolase
MRAKLFELLRKRMSEDESLFLVVADMGLGLVGPVQNEFPNRFLNVGIAEQNMIGVAAGLCNVGFRPFCYTISNFVVQRCFEQIRNDICLHSHPVTLVGSSTGFDNGPQGPTHQVLDDIGCIKILPNMNIYSPSSVNAIGLVFEEIMRNRQPAYVRIGKGSYEIELLEGDTNHMVIANDKSDVLVITHGTMLESCVKAANINNKFSIYCMNKIKPLDKIRIKEIFERYPRIVVVEDHFVTSGLYNSLCQCLAEMQCQRTQLYCLGTPEKYEAMAGDRDYFADKYGYSPAKIAQFISIL